MRIATIGFTRTSAEHFFERLRAAEIGRILDIRLHNASQLAGFAKAGDLAYFAGVILGAGYEHDIRLAPTEAMLSAYRSDRRSWPDFERSFRTLLGERGLPAALDPAPFETRRTVLLCSEADAAHCHRSLVAAMLSEAWGATIEHL